MTAAQPANFSFADILQTVPQFPAPALEPASTARLYWAQQQHQREAIDHRQMAELAAWVAGWRNDFPVQLTHPRIILYAADRSGAGESETADLMALLTAEEAPLVEIAEQSDADLRLYELDLEHPQTGPMTEAECSRLIIYGMMMVEPGLDLLAVTGFGYGADAAAQRLIDQLNNPAAEPLAALAQYGGREIAAILGTLIAARMGRIPVIAEGGSALAAAVVLRTLDRRATQHIAFAGANLLSAEAHGLLTVETSHTGIGLATASLIETIRNACQLA